MTTYLPYTGQVTTYTQDGYIHMKAQLVDTYELSPIQLKLRKGFAIDNHLYLHQVINCQTGEVLKQYNGPIDL